MRPSSSIRSQSPSHASAETHALQDAPFTQSPARAPAKKPTSDASLAGLSSRRRPDPHDPAPPSLARRALGGLGLARVEQAPDIERGVAREETRPVRSAVGTPLAALHRADTDALLGELQHAIGECRERDVNRDEAAHLVNTLRMQRQDGSIGNSTLMTNATRQSEAWYRAQGLTDADIRQVHHAAFTSGLIAPSAGLVSNLLQFFASPFLSAGTGKPWVGAGLGLGVAGIAQTPMYAAQQPVVVQFVEHTAERNGPVIQVDKAHVHHKEWLPDIARRATTQAQALETASAAFERDLEAIAARVPGSASDRAKGSHDERLVGWLRDNAEDPAVTRLRESARAFSDALTGMRDLHEGVLMTQAGHTRQHIGNRFQSISRVMRPVFQSLVGLASGVPKEQAATMAAHVVERVARLSPMSIATIQALGALALTGAQHVSAGYDEVAKVDYKNALNLVYGDFFTEEGNARVAAGKEIGPEHIDEGKLRGLIASPAQSLIKRVTKSLDDVIKQTEAERDAAPAGGEAREQLDNALIAMKADKDKLKANDLAGLSADGHARATLASNAAALLPGVWRDSKRNLNADEIKTQVAQRVGQTYHMGPFGSFASSSIGRVAAAVAGGSSKLKTSYISGFSALGFGLGAIAAYSQGTTTTIKNHGKEADDKLSLGQQTLYGVFALPIDVRGRRLASEANTRAAWAMARAARQIEMADVVLGAG
ncbi:hypothetical protein [Cupriavidus plantarum]|uniref:hypothetical protein n=1 Tax=Cupriavidus plantarum TaxID=942865 RepID=UPI00339D517A